PGLPEEVVQARDWHFFRHFLEDANPPYTEQEIDRYKEAWSQPGAAAGMINYYRASVRQSQKEAAAKLRPLSAPTLVIWGERDSYLGATQSPTSSPISPSLTAKMFLTPTETSVPPTHRTGYITTRTIAATTCWSTSSPPRNKRKARACTHQPRRLP